MVKYSVRKPLTIFVAALAVIILGVVAFLRMTPDLFPHMDFPYVVIMTAYPGASPESVEAEVTKPLEQAMATLEHIENVTSNSSENYSLVMLEFEESVNMDTIGVDIQQNIASLSGQWDTGVGTPYVLKINPSLLPVEIAAVSMEGMDNIQLTDFISETIQPKLDGVTGVARISTIGSVTRQVHAVISQKKIDDVNRRLAEAVNQRMDEAMEDLNKTKSELEDAKDLLDTAGGQLDSGKSVLSSQTASAEAYLNQQTISALDGRMELQQQINQLTDTRATLDTTLKILRPIVQKLTQLETRKADLTARADAIEDAAARLAEADRVLLDWNARIAEARLQAAFQPETPAADGEGYYDEVPTAWGSPVVYARSLAYDPEPYEEPAPQDPVPEPTAEEPVSETDGAADGEVPDEEPALPSEPTPEPEPEAEPEPVTEPEPEPTAEPDPAPELPVPDLTDPAQEILDSPEYQDAVALVASIEAELAALNTNRYAALGELAALRAQIDGLDLEFAAIDRTLESLKLSRAGLSDTVAQMEDGLTQADAGIALLNDALTQLDSGTMQLSEAMGTLSQAKTEGLLQLAQAAAQLSSNSASLEAALSQVDAGLDSLEESREDALASADITDTISLSTVSSILTAQNFTMPAGYVEQDGISYMVSVGDPLKDPEEMGSLLLFDTGEDGIGPVYLRDVADIFVTDNSESTYAKLDGEQGIILTFEKQSNAATADVTDALDRRFRELEEDHPGLHFVSLMNQGEYIYLIVNSILESLVTGAIFAIAVLLLFLRDIRPTVITLVSIPISVVFAVVLMYFSGITLNMISLSGLAVSVGMLVDNSIVVIENIYRLRAKGATAAQAAVAGTRQVAGAITASTLTTVCVFLPIVFVQGITKQLFTDLALTMGYSLMASLVVALTLVPAMSRGMLKNLRQPKWKGSSAAGEGRFYRAYRATITWSLRHKWVVLPLALVLLSVTARLAVAKGFSFMPDMDTNIVNISISMPEEADRAQAAATADEVLSRIQELDTVETVGAMMGGSGLLSAGSSSLNVTAYVTLREGESGAEAGKRLQEMCGDLDCTISYDSAMMNMSYLSGSGVTINVYGSNVEDLRTAARTIADALAGLDGLENADDGLQDAETALHVRVDRNAAMVKGYTVAQLYMQIAAALTDSSTVMTMDLDDVAADVTVSTGSRMTLRELKNLSFEYTDSDGKTKTFPLKDVAKIEETVGLATIQRENQRRYVSVTAAVAEGTNVTLATADAQRAVAELQLPAGVTYEFSGENETIMDAVNDLMLMLLLGFLLVYFIMVAQFQSLRSPFIVMFTIPLAFTGGFLALLIFRMDVSVISLIGFVMLTGIIVNNGIVLVDYVNQLRAGGMERRQALAEAGATRLRPILMTSLTTILGLAVMALGQDVGTALMQPVAVVCIGGLLYATLMTLYVVPCIYDIMNKKEIVVVAEEDMEFDEL